MRALALFGAGFAIAAAGCATGRAPPAATEMANVEKDLTFLFGFGARGCGIPQGNCKDDKNFPTGQPEALVKLPPFAFDIHEVTIEQYEYCVQLDMCSEPSGFNGAGDENYYLNPKYQQHPVVQLTQLQAGEYCAFVGKRLPSEFEWERVAGGPAQTIETKRLYPVAFGAGPDGTVPLDCKNELVNALPCNGGSKRTTKVTTMTGDVVTEAGVKVYDLMGNVSEWTASDADATVTCDKAQPYTCEKCVVCRLTKTDAVCEKDCLGCVCGAGSKWPLAPNCYKPCNAPVCPLRKAGETLDGTYTGKNSNERRIVRGGNYEASPTCGTRFDYRSLAIAPNHNQSAQFYLGFRCAKSL
ncbi:MAG: formylglycine-generating enzyme family protein [Myxococcales bacterium]|nr:formylglycine-generating enzyme family protein [Myxococcales bacterium]